MNFKMSSQKSLELNKFILFVWPSIELLIIDKFMIDIKTLMNLLTHIIKYDFIAN